MLLKVVYQIYLKIEEDKKEHLHKNAMKLPEEKELAEKLLTGFEFFSDLLGRINSKLDHTLLEVTNVVKPFKEYSKQLEDVFNTEAQKDFISFIKIIRDYIDESINLHNDNSLRYFIDFIQTESAKMEKKWA